jgi:hypothetical protein
MPRYSLDYALSMSFEELHIFDISDSHSSAEEDASILVCDAWKHHGPASNTDQTLMVKVLQSREIITYHDPIDSASYPQDLNFNFPVHHSPVLVSSTI